MTKYLIAWLYAEATIQALQQKNQQLHEHVAGYDRLRTAHGQLKGRAAELENRIASADETTRRYWTMIQNGEAEVRQLKEQLRVLSQPNDYAMLERTYDDLRQRHFELGRQNIAMAAQAERADEAEQMLAAAQEEIAQLRIALTVAKLPADGRDKVIQLVQEDAA